MDMQVRSLIISTWNRILDSVPLFNTYRLKWFKLKWVEPVATGMATPATGKQRS